jgi:hypothetical protein
MRNSMQILDLVSVSSEWVEFQEKLILSSNLGLISENTIGITFRHGIYIRSDYWQDDSLLNHELTHTMQYERLGGICNFLNQYIKSVFTLGIIKVRLKLKLEKCNQK